MYFRDTVHAVFSLDPHIRQTVCCQTQNMPALIPKIYTEQKEPFVWLCSDCDQPFSTSEFSSEPRVANIPGLNRDFAQHCRRRHPKSVIVTLPHSEEQKLSFVETLFGWLRTV